MPKYTSNQKDTCPTPNGTLLIIGGAEDKAGSVDPEASQKQNKRHLEILDKFVKMTNTGEPVIEVITTAASKDPAESYQQYRKSFESICSCIVNHIHHDSREEVQADELRQRLETAHAVFFSGGDQLKITSVYGGTELLKIIKERYIYDRLIVAGTSAGAMALSTPMIYAGVGRDEMIAGNVKVALGLEFLKDVCIDTHFVDRGRFVRMAQVLATNPSSIGIGVEENTALIIKNGVELEVIGFGVVIIIDAKKSFGSNVLDFNDENPIAIRGLQVDILSEGEKFNIPQLNQPHN